MASITWEWREVMLPTERQAWRDYAATHPITKPNGESRKIRGWQWFVRWQELRITAGQPVSSGVPPIDTTFDFGDPVVLVVPPSTISMTFTPPLDWAAEAGRILIVSEQRRIPGSAEPDPWVTRQVDVISSDALPAGFPIVLAPRPWPYPATQPPILSIQSIALT